MRHRPRAGCSSCSRSGTTCSASSCISFMHRGADAAVGSGEGRDGVPNVVKDPDQLASANSLGLVAAFGTFPIGAVMFSRSSRRCRQWLGDSSTPRRASTRSKRRCAIWVDGLTFLVSALLISRLRPRRAASDGAIKRVPASQTWQRHRRRAAVRPVQPARARRDDRARGRSRRRRDRSSRSGRCSRTTCWAAATRLRVRLPDDRARRRRGDRCRHAACGCSGGCRADAVFTTAVVATGVAIIAPRGVVAVAPRSCLVALVGAACRMRVRHRIHAAAGVGRRRDARPHLRDALHGRARCACCCR